MLYTMYVIYNACSIQCMLYTMYVIYNVCYIQCMLYTMYVIYNVCYMQCMLYTMYVLYIIDKFCSLKISKHKMLTEFAYTFNDGIYSCKKHHLSRLVNINTRKIVPALILLKILKNCTCSVTIISIVHCKIISTVHCNNNHVLYALRQFADTSTRYCGHAMYLYFYSMGRSALANKA